MLLSVFTSYIFILTSINILQLWYWEKLRFSEIDATLDYTERNIPLMQYWTEEKARKIDRIDDIYNFGAGTVHF